VEDWSAIFGSYLKSGVYMITRGTCLDIRNAAQTGGLEFIEVNLRDVIGKKDFLKKTAGALGFPAYFGMNWDAFSDCLTDMVWKPAAGYVVLFNYYYIFKVNDPADAKTARRIFDSVVQYWSDKKVPFFIVLVEEAPHSA